MTIAAWPYTIKRPSEESRRHRRPPRPSEGPAGLTARQAALHDSLSLADRDRIHAEAVAYAAAVMARFERTRGRR